MKDIVITGRRLKLELLILLACIVVAECANIYAIATHGTPFIEAFSQLGYVTIIGLLIYAIHWVVRIVVWIILRLVKAVAKH